MTIEEIETDTGCDARRDSRSARAFVNAGRLPARSRVRRGAYRSDSGLRVCAGSHGPRSGYWSPRVACVAPSAGRILAPVIGTLHRARLIQAAVLALAALSAATPADEILHDFVFRHVVSHEARMLANGFTLLGRDGGGDRRAPRPCGRRDTGAPTSRCGRRRWAAWPAFCSRASRPRSPSTSRAARARASSTGGAWARRRRPPRRRCAGSSTGRVSANRTTMASPRATRPPRSRRRRR